MRLIPLLLTAMLAMSAQAQEDTLRIDGVMHVASYLDKTIVLAADAEANKGFALHIIDAPLADFRVQLPSSLILTVNSAESTGPSQVLTAVFTSPEGIRLIVQTPCRRYTSLSACIKRHREAVLQMLEEWGIDPKATGEGKIVIPGIDDPVTPNTGAIGK